MSSLYVLVYIILSNAGNYHMAGETEGGNKLRTMTETECHEQAAERIKNAQGQVQGAVPICFPVGAITSMKGEV